MKLIDNFNFDVSYTKSKYNAKPTNVECASMQYIFTHTNLIEFVKRISSGYGYCSVFANDEFGNWGKSDKYFCYTQVISVDVDHSPIDLNEALLKLKTTPSMAYNTFSNGINEYSFRLVFLFDEPIEGVNKAKSYLYSVCKTVSDELNIKVDANAKKVSQYFNGTNDINVFVSDYVYELDDFNLDDIKEDNLKVSFKSIQEEKNNISLNGTFENDTTLIKDYWKLKLTEFLYKYDPIMPNLQNSKLEIPSEDEPFIDIPSDYREIKRYWYLLVDDDGNKLDYIRKIKDGEGRRKKLFLNGIIRRLINPQITFENLLHNIVWEFVTYMVNDGNKITKKILWNIVKDIMNADLTRYSTLGTTSRKWMVNPYFTSKYGMSKREVINKFKHNKKQYIGEFYDCSLSDKENIEMMKEYGLEISLRTLKRWRKENNITKYKK